MELNETVKLMKSANYKERFKAEYLQTKIRYEKLKNLNNRIAAAQETGTQHPPHDCPESLLRRQQRLMGEYLNVLEIRALIEDVDLNIQECEIYDPEGTLNIVSDPLVAEST